MYSPDTSLVTRHRAAACLTLVLMLLVPAAGTQAAGAAANGSAPAQASTSQASTFKPFKASTFIGHRVLALHGDGVGRIDDLVIDLESGKVEYVAVQLDAEADAARRFMLPLRAFMISAGGDPILQWGRHSLGRANSFTVDNWPRLDNPAYWANLADNIPLLPGLPAQPKRYVRASQMIEQEVRSPQGYELGKLDDVVLDLHRGIAVYALLEFDAGPRTDNEFFPYPLSAFSVPARARDEAGMAKFLVLQASREDLLRRKGFRSNELPLGREVGQ